MKFSTVVFISNLNAPHYPSEVTRNSVVVFVLPRVRVQSANADTNTADEKAHELKEHTRKHLALWQEPQRTYDSQICCALQGTAKVGLNDNELGVRGLAVGVRP
ncbi:unnamed protein product [Nesidiocoris tenuis]|uniref:Uncharacterized protein n=1 Tax=Nesidiocoris tenuis TaxID=355587 RepID=A0A6H5HEJ9_9HEMI|nr:unnamed protein product [Nesidiocoris tenuis]